MSTSRVSEKDKDWFWGFGTHDLVVGLISLILAVASLIIYAFSGSEASFKIFAISGFLYFITTIHGILRRDAR